MQLMMTDEAGPVTLDSLAIYDKYPGPYFSFWENWISQLLLL